MSNNNINKETTAFSNSKMPINPITFAYKCKRNIIERIKYSIWYKSSTKQSNDTVSVAFNEKPLFSIVTPTYCTPVNYLEEMILSVINQTYDNWELCIADASPIDSPTRDILRKYEQLDKRIHIVFLDKNISISENTNKAIEISSGKWIGLLDHDDVLASNCLYEIIRLINENPTLEAVYTDEDKINETGNSHFYPHFKPDFNYLLLRSHNYICHFFAFSRTTYEKAGGFRNEYNGSQDYDFILRATRCAQNIGHIPQILYHWRVHRNSMSGNTKQKLYCYEAARNALKADLVSRNIVGAVDFSSNVGFYDTTYETSKQYTVRVISFDNDFVIPQHYGNKYNFIKYEDKPISALADRSYTYTVFLEKGIQTITAKQIDDFIELFSSQNIYATTCKVIFKNRIKTMGCYYKNNSMMGCYNNLSIYDPGYYGRALVNQYVPACPPTAFACLTESLFESTNMLSITDSTTLNIADIALLLSLAAIKHGKSIACTANTTLITLSKTIAQPSLTISNNEKKELHYTSSLYAVPPYYN